MSEKVKLRIREAKDGKRSLYLDIFANGIRKTESLRLYLIPEARRADKAINKRTMEIAESVRRKRETELEYRLYDINNTTITLGEAIDEYISVKSKDNKSETTILTAQIIKRDLQKYLNMQLAKINQSLAREMVEKISKHGKQNTTYRYILVFKAIFNMAVRNEYIPKSPLINISAKQEEVERKFLSEEQLQLLWAKKDMYPQYRVELYMFLFSCLCGLRYSDVIALKWSNIKPSSNGFYRIIFTQKKTKNMEYLDVSPQAMSLLQSIAPHDEHSSLSEEIFPEDRSTSYRKRCIRRATSKILGEEFTFHCARHTFATMMISRGADIYTVSKLLGHKSIVTTQIYAKVVDKTKQAAMNLMPTLS